MLRLACLALLCCGCVSSDISEIRAELAAIERALPEADRTPAERARLVAITERIDGVEAVADAMTDAARTGASAVTGGGPRDWVGLGGSLAALAAAYAQLRRKSKQDSEAAARALNEQRDAARRKRNEVVGDQLARATPPNVAPPADMAPA